MSVRVLTARQVQGPKWAEKYPAKADDLWLFAKVDGKTKKVRIGPPTDENRARADRKAEEWRVALERRSLGDSGLVPPTFTEGKEDFLRHGLNRRAWKTATVREYQLGVLERTFGDERLHRINADAISRWWSEYIDGGGRSVRTGKGYLNAISMLYKHTAKTHRKLENPVPAAKNLIFDSIENTANFRALDAQNCNPMTPADMGKLLGGIEQLGNRDLLMTALLCYEAGLRLGEATGLQWRDVWWGADENDTSRSLSIERARTGNRVGHTKSGRTRKVAISKRLRRILMAAHLEQGRPSGEEFVVAQSWHKNIRERMERAATMAKVQCPKPKDLRDTYASTLISNGIVLKWISLQLGHASLAVTERHYASYMAAEGYRNPWIVPSGSLPPDLFAELDGWGSSKVPYSPSNEKKSIGTGG